MIREYKSENYNYKFNTENGYFLRWGKTLEENPIRAPFPEIIDIEISEACNGIGNGPCKHCYKSNTPKGDYIAYEQFKQIFDKIPDEVTQVALGIGDIDSNPDLFKITEYLRSRNIIPNITINGYGLTDDLAQKFTETFGAVAVSRYNPSDVCYNAVHRLTSAGLKQVNIHMLVSEETFEDCKQVIEDRKTDPRLKELNAIVFLLLKPKGKRNGYHSLAFEKYKELVDLAFQDEFVPIGFDSCSTPLFLEATKEHKNFPVFQTFSDSCESLLFSLYINVRGEVYPCSFLEGEEGYEPINLFEINNFTKEVWESNYATNWRDKLLATNRGCSYLGEDCRMCPHFNIYNGVFG